MQLTRFDRWLRETFVYQTKIMTLRPPPALPRGIRELPFPERPGRRYKHLFLANNAKTADQFIQLLQAENQQFQTLVTERETWFVPLLSPRNKSVTWWLVSTFGFLSLIGSVIYWLIRLLQNPEIRQNLLDALELIRKG